MKVVILAGGRGARLAEATEIVPKPLVQIGERPIIWHIMKSYAAAGFDEFIICCGYKAHMIKSYFVNYFAENYDITVHLGENRVDFHGDPNERWTVTLVDTGLNTMTGGWRRTNLSPPTGIRGSGSPWIPCAISANSRRFGTRAMRPGSAGNDDQSAGQRGKRPNRRSVGSAYAADAVSSVPGRAVWPDRR